MQKVTFITLATPGKSIQKALLMVNSLRSFGGVLKNCPVWILVPERMNEFSQTIEDGINSYEAKIVPVNIKPDVMKFPFASKITAAAHAETKLASDSDLLVWLDCDNIILREPNEFLLPTGKILGYRPVHHKLIGPTWGKPLDPFWKLIYHYCDISEDHGFQMTTHTGEVIRPYFNAGTFVIRPEKGLMAKWQHKFIELYILPEFQTYYQVDNRYVIFMHQAVFTGVLLHELEYGEMVEFSPEINYPLHLHNEIPIENRPSSLNNLTTIRYENIFENPGWEIDYPILQALRSWLNRQIIFKDPLESRK
jgi:hypothetical protein